MADNTVFLIGAGASTEAKLPSSNELKIKISQFLDIRFRHGKQESGDYVILEALRMCVRGAGGQQGSIEPYLSEAWRIRDALPLAISIDNFLDAHRGNDKIALCGKLAIVRSILNAERLSRLYFDESKLGSKMNLSALKETWYRSFFQLLTENCTVSDLKDRFKSIALIIFNYDRCVEHFLYFALQDYYGISANEAAEIINSINIYHPYGNVGNLPWADGDGVMEFGAEPTPKQILELSQKIKTFTEGTDPRSSEILEIHKHVSVAHRLVFMGFAFHKLNMQLITPKNVNSGNKTFVKCFATTYRISDSDREVIDGQIRGLYNHGVTLKMSDSTCCDFFTEYWRSLSF